MNLPFSEAGSLGNDFSCTCLCFFQLPKEVGISVKPSF